MAHAYTPGLKVTESTLLEKERKLPIKGKVIVEKGQKVSGDDVVARTELPGNVTTLNIAGILSIPPEDIKNYMLKKEGDEVKKGEIIAQSKGLFGLFKTTVESPIDGTIESISSITGQVILREYPQPIEIKAYIDGTIKTVLPEEGVIVETWASLIQGIFGFGGERRGYIKVVVSSPDEVLTENHITPDMKGCLIVGGSLVTTQAIKKALSIGVKGVVAGGIEDHSIKEILGKDIGVAITGSEPINITVIVTEGFGRMRMAERTFNLLKKLDGELASFSGATQIRAGVIRPEIIVSREKPTKVSTKMSLEEGLKIGMMVRIIREPYFGKIGRVTKLPVELTEIETESKVRILEVELEEEKKRIMVPRANVEIIEM